MARTDRRPVSMADRIVRVPVASVMWILSTVAAVMALAPAAALGTFIWNLTTDTGVSIVPGVVMWPMGGWVHTLLYSLASLAILAGCGTVLEFVAFRALRFLWGTHAGGIPWAQRCCGVGLIPSSELDLGAVRPRRWFQTSSGLMGVVLIGMTLCVGWLLVEVNLDALVTRASLMGRIVDRLVHPDFSVFAIPDPLLQDSISTAMVETIFMALFATLLGFAIAFPLSFLGARNLMSKGRLGWVVYTGTRAFFNIFRSVEVLIWALIFAVWVNFGPFAGVIALAIHTIAALGKLFSEQVEAIDPGPVEAMTAAGARRWQVIIHGIIPQIVPSFMAFTMYRWDINVRMSTVIGLVGGGGIGRLLFYYYNELQWERVGAVVITVIVVVWSMDYISARVRERIT